MGAKPPPKKGQLGNNQFVEAPLIGSKKNTIKKVW